MFSARSLRLRAAKSLLDVGGPPTVAATHAFEESNSTLVASVSGIAGSLSEVVDSSDCILFYDEARTKSVSTQMRLLTVVNTGAGAVWSFDSAEDGRILEMSQTAGTVTRHTRFDYDGWGRLVGTERPTEFASAASSIQPGIFNS